MLCYRHPGPYVSTARSSESPRYRVALGDAQPTSNCTAFAAFTCNDGSTEIAHAHLFWRNWPRPSSMLQHNPSSYVFTRCCLVRGWVLYWANLRVVIGVRMSMST